MFAIGKLNKAKTVVSGGTGWGVQMGIDLAQDVYVFDQDEPAWFVWSPMEAEFVKMEEKPLITGQFAGIGTRQIEKVGVKAIADLITASLKASIDNLFLP